MTWNILIIRRKLRKEDVRCGWLKIAEKKKRTVIYLSNYYHILYFLFLLSTIYVSLFPLLFSIYVSHYSSRMGIESSVECEQNESRIISRIGVQSVESE